MKPSKPRRDPNYVNDWKPFLIEFRLETDRGCALLGPAFIDDLLISILTKHFIQREESSKCIENLRSSTRDDLAYGLGLITTREYNSIKAIRKIRNEFAHTSMGTTFNSQEVVRLIKKLPAAKERTPSPTDTNRNSFEIAVAVLVYDLFGRSPRLAELGLVAREFDKV